MQEQGGSKDIRTPPDYNRGVRTPTTPPVPAALVIGHLII